MLGQSRKVHSVDLGPWKACCEISSHVTRATTDVDDSQWLLQWGVHYLSMHCGLPSFVLSFKAFLLSRANNAGLSNTRQGSDRKTKYLLIW